VRRPLAVLATLLLALPVGAGEPPLADIHLTRPGTLPFRLLRMGSMPLFQVTATNPAKTLGGGAGFTGGTVPGATLFPARVTFGTAADALNAVDLNETAGRITFEGATADAFESRFGATDPTVGDQTFLLPNLAAAGTDTIATLGIANAFSGANTFSSTSAFSGATSVASNTLFCLNGLSTYPCMIWSTPQTPDATMFLAPAATSRAFIFTSDANPTFDRAHANPANPTIFVDDGTASTTKWLSLAHNGTDGVVTVGTGAVNLGTFAGGLNLAGSSAVLSANVGDFVQFNTGSICWSSSSAPSVGTPAKDTCFKRKSAAFVQVGSDVNGTGTDYSFTGPNGITGTDTIGGALKHASGLGTGAGVSHPYEIDRQITKATGTTTQTFAPAVIVCPSKILSNTSAQAQAIATITTTTTTGGSVTYDYTVIANNGTLQDVDGGMVKVSWNNNANTVAAAMTAVTLQSDSDASGTLASTPTATVATNVVTIKLTPTWVTIVPTSVTALAIFHVFSVGDTVACQ
jgi:hypothetical protein